MKAALSPYSCLSLLGHVDDGTTDATLAELRGREQEHDRFFSEHVGVVDPVLGVRRDAGGDLREIAADVGWGRGVDLRRLLAGPRDAAEFADHGARQQRSLDFAVFLDQGRDPPLAVAGKVEFGSSRRRWRRRGRRAVVWARKAGLVARLSIEAGKGPTAGCVQRLCLGLRGLAFVARLRFRARPRGRGLGEVEGDFGVRHLGAIAFEDAERVAVLALVEDHRGRRDDQFGGAVGRFQHLAQRPAVGVGEIALRAAPDGFRRSRRSWRWSRSKPESPPQPATSSAARSRQAMARARRGAARIGGMLFETGATDRYAPAPRRYGR